jgi:Homing endonuclease associated repeat
MSGKTKEEIVEEIRSVAQALNTTVLSSTKFFTYQKNVTVTDVNRIFGKWSVACEAAGIDWDRSTQPISNEDLLSEWGRVTRNLGHTPSINEYKLNSPHDRGTFNRFGKWVNVPEAFCKHFADSEEWTDVLTIVSREVALKEEKSRAAREAQHDRRGVKPLWHRRLDRRPIYGDPIDFRGLRHAPVNEQGVVFLFGMVARELGYLVEAIQAGFPDCEAKRQISPGQWQPVSIEFEFESKNFIEHGHSIDDCDVIVCWKHDWQECPEDLEAIELSEEIKKLSRT